MNPILRVKALERYLGSDENRVHVLRGVDLALIPGQTCAIVGPSGCGKSTLLYLLGLLDRPDAGKIFLGEEELSAASDDSRTAARNAKLGFVFQFHFLLSEFSAQENVMLPMQKLGQLSDTEMCERSESLLRSVDLGDKIARAANHLSGGEQQRVAIARALANNPSILLADEPTGNLDARNSALVFDLLQKVSRESGQAVLIVTHNLDLAKRCDRVLTMRDGQFVSAS